MSDDIASGAPAPVDPVEAARRQWNSRYELERYYYGTEPNDFLRATVESMPRGRTLCVAEGEGRNAVFLAESGFTVSSVDLSDAGVAKTRRLASARGVTVDANVGDLGEVDLGIDQWDLIVSVFAHLPPRIRRSLHRRIVAALAPGGVLVLEAYTPDQIGRGTGGPPAAEFTMTLDSLRQELDGLEFEHGVETERSVIEGPGHTGVGAVVQVVARRPGGTAG